MQTTSTTPVTFRYSGNGRVPETTSSAVTVAPETETALPTSATVTLSGEAMDRYIAHQNQVEADDDEGSENPLQKAGQEMAEEVDSGSGSDPVAETLERLQAMLREALKRLDIAQQHMNQVMAEMSRAGDAVQKMSILTRVQAAQVQVISANGEVMQIQAQINKVLEEQRKAAKSASSSG